VNRRDFITLSCEAALAAKLGVSSTVTAGASVVDRVITNIHSSLADAIKTPAALLPIPKSNKTMQNPVLDLAGPWMFTLDPPDQFWKRGIDSSSWSTVHVPGEFATQGFDVSENVEYPCRRTVKIPNEFKGQRLFLRFDGVYGHARVWVNGMFVREHFGGFTSWDCEITSAIGQDTETIDLVVGVTDRSDDISQASYYAKHSIAGILRGVRLIALPPLHLEYLSVAATLDSKYKDGVIAFSAALSPQNYKTAEFEFRLEDKSKPQHFELLEKLSVHPGEDASKVLKVLAPKKWDAEHPNLYTLEIKLSIDGELIQTFERNIGFRTVARVGNELQVNGQSVKLRGVCHHSIHPLHGRAVPVEFDEKDARLFREANINFVRTSHYPPTEEFLDACDRHGIYVEEETAVCWSELGKGPSSDQEFSSRFMSQFREMIERDHGHAAVVFWSLGNESEWGENFALEYQYARKRDPSRPLIFSYPDTTPWGTSSFDIYSKHYPDVDSDLSSESFPVLGDEFGHISCYNVDTLRRDPGVRNFWGKSIKRFGDKFIESKGCLGGSIWAAIDDVFLLPKGPVGYGPWGVIDGWRRPKPEYWLTKKAYSPIRMDDKPISVPADNDELQIPIYNAFDHTNIAEVNIDWKIGQEHGRLKPTDIAPHSSGYLRIPSRKWSRGEVLDISFTHSSNIVVDQVSIRVGERTNVLSSPEPGALKLVNTSTELQIQGPNFMVSISRLTGLIARATCNGEVVLEGGPFLDMGAGQMDGWLLKKLSASLEGDIATILISGDNKQSQGWVGTVGIDFEIKIDSGGLITTHYQLRGSSEYTHLGLGFLLPATVDKLIWDRESLWSTYPEDHIGRPKGIALKRASHPAQSYRAEPSWPWSQDVGDFLLFGKDGPAPYSTNDFRSLKENVWYASCVLAQGEVRARIEASGDIAVRTSSLADGRVLLSAFNYWKYPDLEWGNYTGVSKPPAESNYEIRLRLTNMREV
jgi:hypothetical protein